MASFKISSSAEFLCFLHFICRKEPWLLASQGSDQVIGFINQGMTFDCFHEKVFAEACRLSQWPRMSCEIRYRVYKSPTIYWPIGKIRCIKYLIFKLVLRISMFDSWSLVGFAGNGINCSIYSITFLSDK